MKAEQFIHHIVYVREEEKKFNDSWMSAATISLIEFLIDPTM